MIWDMIVFVFVCCFAFFPHFFFEGLWCFLQKALKKPTVCSNVGWPLFRVCWVVQGALKKDEPLWPWVLQLLFEDVPCFFFFGGRCDLKGYTLVLDGVEMKKIRKYWKWIIYYIIIYNYYIYIHIYIYVKLPLQGVFVSLCFIELLWYS